MAGRSTTLAGPSVPDDWQVLRSGGPAPFTSWVEYQRPDGSHYVWDSRAQRKGYGPRRGTAGQRAVSRPWTRFWAPDRLAWWVAVVFVVGSAFFVLGAVATLIPSLFGEVTLSSIVGEACYTVGALLYTISVYGQLLESLNADDRITARGDSTPPGKWRWFGLEPGQLGFWPPAAFFVGALIFDYETIAALFSYLGVVPKEVGLWWTALLGGLFFLVAAVLQAVEVGHGRLRLQPGKISWWVALWFVVGSIGFVLGSLPGFQLLTADAEQEPGPLVVKVGFLAGAVAFLVGSYLMIPELFSELEKNEEDPAGVSDAASER